MSVFKITDNGATYYSASIDSLAAGSIKKERLEKMSAEQVSAVVTALGFDTETVGESTDLKAMSATIRLLSSWLNQSRDARRSLALELLNVEGLQPEYIEEIQTNCSVGWNVMLAWIIGADGEPVVPEDVAGYIGQKKAEADAAREASGKDAASLDDLEQQDEAEEMPAF